MLIQADNTWQTVATALSVGLRGGVVAVLSPHATASEFVLAVEDVDPDMVVADLRTLEQWGCPTRTSRRATRRSVTVICVLAVVIREVCRAGTEAVSSR